MEFAVTFSFKTHLHRRPTILPRPRPAFDLRALQCLFVTMLCQGTVRFVCVKGFTKAYASKNLCPSM